MRFKLPSAEVLIVVAVIAGGAALGSYLNFAFNRPHESTATWELREWTDAQKEAYWERKQAD